MQFGVLKFSDVANRPELVAATVSRMIETAGLSGVYAAEIDPALSDTAAFCERYKIGMEVSANCVIIEAKRADKTWYAACVILATDRADINGTIRRHLNARKTSFASMDMATRLTGMEYGGITPIGLPADWPIVVDDAVVRQDRAIIGSGVRTSKLLVPGRLLAALPHAVVMDIKRP